MQLKHTLTTALAAAAVQAQSDNSTGSANLTSLLSGNQNLTALTTLLTAYPDLVSSLSNATNITLLAPSNQALNSLNSSGALQQAAMMQGYIQALLSYHVLVGEFYAENITETPAFPQTLLNNTMFSNVTGGQVVECRKEDNGVYFISGLKNNVSVSQPVSKTIQPPSMTATLTHDTRISTSPAALSMSSTDFSPSRPMSAP